MKENKLKVLVQEGIVAVCGAGSLESDFHPRVGQLVAFGCSGNGGRFRWFSQIGGRISGSVIGPGSVTGCIVRKHGWL
jgi:hypothetical protein